MRNFCSNALQKKVSVVTGSTSGIGLGIAKGLASNGVNVVINGFGDTNEIEAARKDIETSYGVKCLYHPADMSQPTEIKKLIQSTISLLGSVDILVNNAGIQHVSKIEDFPEDKYEKIMAINCSSAFYTTKYSIPNMKQNKWGRVINIASAHSHVASPFKSAYVTAKHGVLGLTKTVALEVAEDNITVNAVCPGYVFTPLVENQIKDTAIARNLTEEQVVNDVLLKAQYTKKFVEIDQVAAIVNFLCTTNASNITGTSISVDGGWTAA